MKNAFVLFSLSQTPTRSPPLISAEMPLSTMGVPSRYFMRSCEKQIAPVDGHCRNRLRGGFQPSPPSPSYACLFSLKIVV